MWRVLRLLNFRRLRRQPVRALIALVSVAAGVALVSAIPVVSASTKQSIRDFGRSLAGPAPLRVIGPVARGGLDESALATVEHTPGVGAAVPLVQAVTYVESRHGEDAVIALGITCRAEALFGAFNCSQPALDSQPIEAPPITSAVLTRAMHGGGLLRTDIGDVEMVRALPLARLNAVNGGHVVVMPLRLAQQRFARPNALDVVYVEPAPGTNVASLQTRLQHAVGGWNRVLTPNDPPPGANLAGSLLLPLLGLMGLFALGIGAVLIRNTVALSVEERRRDLAIVSAIGAPTHVVRGGVVTESAVIGVFGGVLGALAGFGVAHPLAAALSSFSQKFGGFRISVHATPFPFVFGAVLGVVIAIIAAWRPATLATRIDVAAELSNRDQRDEAAPALNARRGIVYTAIGLGAIALEWVSQRNGGIEAWAPITAQVGMLVSLLFLILAVGSFAPVVVHMTRGVTRRRSAGVRLAWANLVREPSRTRVMAVGVASAVGVAFTLANTNRSIHTAVTDSILKTYSNRVGVSTLQPNNSLNIDAKLSPAHIAALGATPGVARVDRHYDLLVGNHDKAMLGVSGDEHPNFSFALISGHADRSAFDRGEVLIGPALARKRHIRPGDMLRLPARTGWADVRVQGVWQDGDFNGTHVTMPASLLTKLWGPQPSSNVTLVPRDGVTPDVLRATILSSRISPWIRAETKQSLARIIGDEISQQLKPFWAMQRGLILVSFIAVLFTLLLAAVQRRREMGLLAAVGMRPRELMRMVVLEAIVVGVIGAALGTTFSIAMSEAFRQAAVILVGFRDPLTLAWWAPAVWAPTVIAVVALAALFPAWRSSRIDVVDALRYE